MALATNTQLYIQYANHSLVYMKMLQSKETDMKE